MSKALPKNLQPRQQHSAWYALAAVPFLIAGAVLCEKFPTEGIKLYREQRDSEFVLGQDEFSKREARLFQNGMMPLSKRVFIPHHLESSDPPAIQLFKRPLTLPKGKVVSPTGGPPSTQLLPEDKILTPDTPPIISLVADTKELFDPVTGIVPNYSGRGRDWERRAWLTAKDHTGVLMETPIGIRIHGGKSRGTDVKSFGLYFRKKYQGTETSPHDKLFGPGARSAEKIALINGNVSTRYMGAMTTEMAAIVGCKVSKVRPVSVYLNGQRIRSPYFLFEHQSEGFIKDYYGCEDPFVIRLKAENDKNEFYSEWRKAVLKDKKNKWSMKMLDKYFDIDDLCAWALLITYTITLDNNQGMYYYDQAKKHDNWKCLTWDLDGCYNRVFSGAGSSKPIYETDPFLLISQLRGTMFNRLMRDSTEFFNYYEDFCNEVLTKKLTKEVALELLDKYEKLSKTYENIPRDLPMVLKKTRAFLETRHDFYFNYLKEQRIKFGHPPRKTKN